LVIAYTCFILAPIVSNTYTSRLALISSSHSYYIGFYRLGSATGVCHELATFSNLRLLFPSLWQYLHFIHTSIFVNLTVVNLRLLFPVLCFPISAFREIGIDNLTHSFTPTWHFSILTDIYSRSAGSLDVFKSVGLLKRCYFA